MSAAHATIPKNYATAGLAAARASRARALLDGLGREWRRASWVVRLSVSCLLLFYFFAAASPFIAPYGVLPLVARPTINEGPQLSDLFALAVHSAARGQAGGTGPMTRERR